MMKVRDVMKEVVPWTDLDVCWKPLLAATVGENIRIDKGRGFQGSRTTRAAICRNNSQKMTEKADAYCVRGQICIYAESILM